jgi:phosphomethylpyrimidine synthase
MTLIDQLKTKNIPRIVKQVCLEEKIKEDVLKENILNGKVIISKNINSSRKPLALGKGLRTKVNANIGTSSDYVNLSYELKKIDFAIKAGADAIMDLSTGGNLDKIRKEILAYSPVAVGTVPIYQVVCDTIRYKKEIKNISVNEIFDVIEKHAQDGVDFVTVHCGVTKKNLEILKNKKRVCGIVSRGGSFMAEWVLKNNKENPLYEHYDRLLKIAKKFDMTLSLGDGLRPGSIADANDEAQIAELKVLAQLAKIANQEGVQVMIEGPGHMPLDEIADHIKLEKKLTNEKPFYLLGPLVTDIAAGYDHITSAIGAAIAAANGADFICYVTPAEHLRLPDEKDVYEGVIAARIAAHAGDIVKGVAKARELDIEMSKARKNLDWEKQIKFALDPQKVKSERQKLKPKTKDVCSMCGTFCAMKESTKIGI